MGKVTVFLGNDTMHKLILSYVYMCVIPDGK